MNWRWLGDELCDGNEGVTVVRSVGVGGWVCMGQTWDQTHLFERIFMKVKIFKGLEHLKVETRLRR